MNIRYLVPPVAALLGAGLAVLAFQTVRTTSASDSTQAKACDEHPQTEAQERNPVPRLSSLLESYAKRAECPPAPHESIRDGEPAAASARPSISEEDVRKEIELIARQGGLPGSGPRAKKLLASIEELGDTGTHLLLAGIGSEDANERVVAAQLLGQLDDSIAVSALADAAMNDSDEKVAAVASQSLALMDVDPADAASAREALLNLATKPNGAASEVNAIYGLCKLSDPEGTQRALDYLASPDRVPQAKAVLAINLARLSLPTIIPVMDQAVAMFADSAAPVVSAAIQYYSALGTASAQARLASLAKNPTLTPQLKQTAADALLPSNGSPHL
jgi:hypothetical protein